MLTLDTPLFVIPHDLLLRLIRHTQRARGTTHLDLILADVLDELPADDREVIVLRNLQNLSHEEVAERMNRSPGAVRILWVRALAALRELLSTRYGLE